MSAKRYMEIAMAIKMIEILKNYYQIDRHWKNVIGGFPGALGICKNAGARNLWKSWHIAAHPGRDGEGG
jgi:hypothetical protein